ncbi:MAG: MFS transporter [Candidatus Thermoplasmatota archaeon]|nr:MFS transporter [Candidatus Thermoplasmatota archaeon]
MVEYKWIALSNTTIGVMMATINQTILLISLPVIFRHIDLDPFLSSSFPYFLWILMGFNIVTATLLLTFGRLSDMYGRVRLFNLGFIVFTAGSVILSITPFKGTAGASFIIAFRLVQGLGAAFLFSNSAAILTDAFPNNERGTALGINSIAAIGGSLIGIILGGVLSVVYWRAVFIVSVPFGVLGTVWSYVKLKDTSTRDKTQKVDYVGNTAFAVGLTLVLVGLVYGLESYNGLPTGFGNPWVLASFGVGGAMLVAFPFIESKVRYPMFKLSLFRIRPFAFGNFANLLSALARGGVMIMMIVLLQGIYLPLKGYPIQVTPFWAGIYMVPMTAGYLVMSPISGKLSDKYGARELATLGMVIVAVSLYLVTFLPYDFYYPTMAGMLLLMGIGNGLFTSPNSAAIMNAVPRETRGVASGMRSTMMNTGMTLSIGMFFVLLIYGLSSRLPVSIDSSLNALNASSLIPYFSSLNPTVALFSAFLGENPVSLILAHVSISHSLYVTLTSNSWFSSVLAPAFMDSFHMAFYVGAGMAAVAAAVSISRGKMFVYERDVENRQQEGTNVINNNKEPLTGMNNRGTNSMTQRGRWK